MALVRRVRTDQQINLDGADGPIIIRFHRREGDNSFYMTIDAPQSVRITYEDCDPYTRPSKDRPNP